MREIEEAVALVETGDVSEGLRRLELAEADASDEEKFQMAELYFEWGHIEKAKAIIENLLTRHPDEPDLIFFLAELLVDLNEEEHAIDMLAGMETEGENRIRALLLLADIYSSQGLDEVAEQKLLQAKRMAPDEPVIAFALGQFYYSLGDDPKSAVYYEEILEKGGDIPGENVHLRLADALSGSGKFEEALAFYEKGVADSPDPDGLFRYGFTAYRAGEYKTAVRVLSELKQLDHDYGKLYIYLAKAHRAEGAIAEALQAAEEGLEVDALNDELAYEAGMTALKAGSTETAQKYLERALSVNSLHHGALKTLAGLFFREQRYEEMVDLLENIADGEEHDPIFTWYLASANRELERYGEARSLYEHALESFEGDPAFLEEYGDFLLEEGHPADAVALFKKAMSIDPSLIHLEEKILHFDG